MRVEHQRRLVAQLALHNYPAERAQSVLADCERTLQHIREEQAERAGILAFSRNKAS